LGRVDVILDGGDLGAGRAGRDLELAGEKRLLFLVVGGGLDRLLREEGRRGGGGTERECRPVLIRPRLSVASRIALRSGAADPEITTEIPRAIAPF